MAKKKESNESNESNPKAQRYDNKNLSEEDRTHIALKDYVKASAEIAHQKSINEDNKELIEAAIEDEEIKEEIKSELIRITDKLKKTGNSEPTNYYKIAKKALEKKKAQAKK
jgi:hypothetical protein